MSDSNIKGSTKLPEATNERLLEVLRRRVARLGQLLEFDAPGVVIAQEAWMVFRRACAIWPNYAGEFFAQWIRGWEISGAAYCPECGGERQRVFPCCDACMEGAAIEFSERAAEGGDHART